MKEEIKDLKTKLPFVTSTKLVFDRRRKFIGDFSLLIGQCYCVEKQVKKKKKQQKVKTQKL